MDTLYGRENPGVMLEIHSAVPEVISRRTITQADVYSRFLASLYLPVAVIVLKYERLVIREGGACAGIVTSYATDRIYSRCRVHIARKLNQRLGVAEILRAVIPVEIGVQLKEVVIMPDACERIYIGDGCLNEAIYAVAVRRLLGIFLIPA